MLQDEDFSAPSAETFSDGESDDLNETFSDEVTMDTDIHALLNESSSPAENSIEVYLQSVSLGCYSTLDEAMEQLTDPSGHYRILLSQGTYELNGASLIAFRGEAASDRLSVTGSPDSRINLTYASEGSGFYGAELNIGTLYVDNDYSIICSSNANQTIRRLVLVGTGKLFFSDINADSPSISALPGLLPPSLVRPSAVQK